MGCNDRHRRTACRDDLDESAQVKRYNRHFGHRHQLANRLKCDKDQACARRAARSGFKKACEKKSDKEHKQKDAQSCEKKGFEKDCAKKASKCREDEYKRKNDLCKNAASKKDHCEDSKAFACNDKKVAKVCDENKQKRRKFHVRKFFEKKWEEDVCDNKDNRTVVKDACKSGKKHSEKKDSKNHCNLQKHDNVHKEHDAQAHCAQKAKSDFERRCSKNLHAQADCSADAREFCHAGEKKCDFDKARKAACARKQKCASGRKSGDGCGFYKRRNYDHKRCNTRRNNCGPAPCGDYSACETSPCGFSSGRSCSDFSATDDGCCNPCGDNSFSY